MTAPVASLENAWSSNPFESDAARKHSSYSGCHEGELVRLLETARVPIFARVANDAFRSFVLDDAFSCLGAKAAIRRGTYRIGVYARLDAPDVTAGLMRDLYAFVQERRGFAGNFTTFAAVFADRDLGGERAFERALWSQLQRVHDADRHYSGWDPRVSRDPADPNFSFSVAGEAFFVIGLNPFATRTARRFAWPALVFNAHEQFERLRADGTFAGLQGRIRDRERRLDGALNANLSEYGHHSEARQYSGRPIEADWRCPFSPPT